VSAGILDDLYSSLRAWVESSVPKAKLRFDAPTVAADGDLTVSAYVCGLSQAPRAQPPEPSLRVVELEADVLVTAHAESAAEAAEAVARLATSDTESLGLKIQPSVDQATWLAFGLPPQPALLLHGLVRWETPRTVPKRVRTFSIQSGVARTVEGTLLGPGGVALANATVELDAIGARSRTNAFGQFRFGAIPAGEDEMALTVSARGRRYKVTGGSRLDKAGRWLVEIEDAEF
jgi:hypothetical protein